VSSNFDDARHVLFGDDYDRTSDDYEQHAIQADEVPEDLFDNRDYTSASA
jgi:hypothetical protein